MMRTTTRPAWAPVFHALITHLTPSPPESCRRPHDADQGSLVDVWDEAFDGSDDPYFQDDPHFYDEGDYDLAEEKTEADDTAYAYGPQEAEVRPPFLQTLAALHLARTFRPLQQLHAPGALTLFDPGTATLVTPLAKVIEKAVTAPSGQSGLLIVQPSGEGASAENTFLEFLRSSLFENQPCLILLQPGISLPEDLKKLLPAPLTPPPLDRAALRELLRVMFPGATAGQLARALAAMPKDLGFSAFSPEALALAFRGVTPKAVITALATQAAPVRADVVRTLTFSQFDPEQKAVQVVRQTAEDLTNWRAGRLPWSDIPNGLLLYGPPGTGKTLLARALAIEAGIPLIEATLGEWQQKNSLGPTLERMQASFAEARRASPSIFFLDEIDAIGTRAERNHNSSYNDQLLTAFLLAVSRLRLTEGVIMMGATNRLEGLDPAVLRPGRFDLKLSLGRPSRAGIRAILAKLLVDTPLSTDALERLSRRALGLSPAEIDGALRQARAACRAANQPLSEETIATALDNGAQASPELGWRIALHEAGHAVLGIRLGMGIICITAGPREGRVDWIPGPEEGLVGDFRDRIALLMAGRAAEEVLLDSPSAGSGGPKASDLAQATQVALDLELRLGLGDSGLLWWGASSEVLLTDQDLRQRVDAHLQTGLDTAKSVILQMPRLVEKLAEAVLQEGELSGPALADWVERIRNSDTEIRKDR